MKKTILLIAFMGLPLTAFAADITVAAAANVQFAINDLKAEFARETGITVKTVIGSSGKLTAQVENGAPFDVFLSADMKYPQKLYKDGFSTSAPKVYTYGVLVLWTVKNLDLSQGINVLNDPKIQKIALADPELAPYGRQTVNTLKSYKLYDRLKKELVLAESISQASQFIATGAADIGFTAESIVLAPSMQGKGRWIEIPPQSYNPIAQGAVMLKYGQQNHGVSSRAFYDFLFSGPARKIFKKYGYSLPHE
jgi:molybdate transport system substrate-binding protein